MVKGDRVRKYGGQTHCAIKRPKHSRSFGAASGFRTHDIRCHRAAFCH
jgi:hypothetical protein